LNFVFLLFILHEDEKESPIGGGDAYLPESFVRQAVDVMLRWPIYYDLSFLLIMDYFYP
jgi:hypothetical protein